MCSDFLFIERVRERASKRVVAIAKRRRWLAGVTKRVTGGFQLAGRFVCIYIIMRKFFSHQISPLTSYTVDMHITNATFSHIGQESAALLTEVH